MIVRKNQPTVQRKTSDGFGTVETARYSDAGPLTQFGAHVQTLQPGARTSNRHWHEREEEFLFVLVGQVAVTENDGEHVLLAGDAACWPAGVPNAHYVSNQSDSPCSFLVVGTRFDDDICHYPDLGRTLYTEGDTWRLEDAEGNVVKTGRT